MGSIGWSRTAAVVLCVVWASRIAWAQPQPAQGSAPVTVEVEDDVEVVAAPPASESETAPAAPDAPPSAATEVAPGAPSPAPESPAPETPATAAAPVPASDAAPAAPVGPAQPAAPVEPATPAQAAAAAPAADGGKPAEVLQAEAQAQAERLAALEARLNEIEAARAAAAGGQRAATSDEEAARLAGGTPPEAWLGVLWSAFIQSEYRSGQLSEDQLFPGGEPRNLDSFVVRRARLRMQRSWQYAGVDLELDASTVRGLELGMRRLSGFVFWSNSEVSAVPVVRLSAGLLDIPFGYELPAGARARLFAERSIASQAYFPIEADVGASVDGGIGPLRYAVAIMNGLEADNRYRLRDVNSAKDLLVRVGVDVSPLRALRVLGGVSILEGTGFHPGSAATKNTLQWNDINEDGSKTDAEVAGAPGSAAEPSRNFDRWAVGLDARVGLRSELGWSWLSGEVSVAQNLDRGRFVADPIAASLDLRELGYLLSFTQDLTPYVTVGFRTDYYDGNSDFIERRRNQAFRQPRTIRTYSPVVGVTLPGYARLSFQYDFTLDTLGRDERGEPTDLKNDAWTVRLQVGL